MVRYPPTVFALAAIEPALIISSSDALDFAGMDTPSKPQQTTPTALTMTGVGRDGTAEEVQHMEVDAKEVEAFWTSLEAFLASSSESPASSSMEIETETTTTTTSDSVGHAGDRDDELTKFVVEQDVVCGGR